MVGNDLDHSQGQSSDIRCKLAGYDEKPVVGEFEEADKIKVEFKNYIGGEQMLQYSRRSRKAPSTRSSAMPVHSEIRRAGRAPIPDASMFKNPPTIIQSIKTFHCCAPGGKTWGIATRFSCYGISYNKKYVSPEEVDTWQVLFRPSTRARS
jgi:spermidine/putrescine transport system substrate-binding protein